MLVSHVPLCRSESSDDTGNKGAKCAIASLARSFASIKVPAVAAIIVSAALSSCRGELHSYQPFENQPLVFQMQFSGDSCRGNCSYTMWCPSDSIMHVHYKGSVPLNASAVAGGVVLGGGGAALLGDMACTPFDTIIASSQDVSYECEDQGDWYGEFVRINYVSAVDDACSTWQPTTASGPITTPTSAPKVTPVNSQSSIGGRSSS